MNAFPYADVKAEMAIVQTTVPPYHALTLVPLVVLKPTQPFTPPGRLNE